MDFLTSEKHGRVMLRFISNAIHWLIWLYFTGLTCISLFLLSPFVVRPFLGTCTSFHESCLHSPDDTAILVLRDKDCGGGFGLGYLRQDIFLHIESKPDVLSSKADIRLFSIDTIGNAPAIQIKWEDNHTPVVVIPNAMGDILVNYRVFKYGLYRPKLIFEPDNPAARLAWFQQSKFKLDARMIRNYNFERLNIPPEDLVSSNPCVLCWDHIDIDAVGDP